MNCTECLRLVAVADVTDADAIPAVADHCHECDECARVVDDVRATMRHAAALLDVMQPGVSSPAMARRAIALAALRRRRRRRLQAVGWTLAATTLVGITLARGPGNSLISFAPRESRTVALRCLTAEQAANIVRVNATPDVEAIVPGRGLRIMTIRGAVNHVRELERTLKRLDNAGSLAPGVSCAGEPAPASAAPVLAAPNDEATTPPARPADRLAR